MLSDRVFPRFFTRRRNTQESSRELILPSLIRNYFASGPLATTACNECKARASADSIIVNAPDAATFLEWLAFFAVQHAARHMQLPKTSRMDKQRNQDQTQTPCKLALPLIGAQSYHMELLVGTIPCTPLIKTGPAIRRYFGSSATRAGRSITTARAEAWRRGNPSCCGGSSK